MGKLLWGAVLAIGGIFLFRAGGGFIVLWIILFLIAALNMFVAFSWLRGIQVTVSWWDKELILIPFGKEKEVKELVVAANDLIAQL